MIKSIKTFVATVLAASALLFPMLAPVTVHAADLTNSLCNGIELNGSSSGTGTCSNGANQDNSLNRIITLVINTFSVIVGFIAIVMMIYGGFKYITSGGDSGKVTSAKNTILYALIGIVIVALAQLLVRFVFAKATNAISDV